MPHRPRRKNQASPDIDDLLDYVDVQVGPEHIEQGLAAIQLKIFEQKAWTQKQKDAIHKRVELHKTAREDLSLGKNHFRDIKTGKIVKSR